MKKRMLLMMVLVIVVAIFANAKTITTVAATSSTDQYTISGTTITVKVKKGKDISTNTNAALLKASALGKKKKKVYTVKIPKGTYKLTTALHIYSYTKLSATGCTIKWSSSDSNNMLVTGDNDYNTSSKCKKYSGFKNITVVGGTWVSKSSNTSSIMRFFHATNVRVENVTYKGGGSAHQVEVASINKLVYKKCTFMNHGKSASDTTNTENQEALQLDVTVDDDVLTSVYQDGTPLKNVTVTGCTFKNVARGVGTHTLLLGSYHDKIKITNNKFVNVLEEAIVTLGYKNCTITGNTISNCGGGIVVQNFKDTTDSIYQTVQNGKKTYKGTFVTNVNTTIANNTIKTKYSVTSSRCDGITVYGMYQTKSKKGADGKTVAAGSYLIGKVTVKNNKITTAAHGIHLYGATNCTVKDNTITGKNFSSSDSNKSHYCGIMVESYCSGITITRNTISNMPKDGICVQNYSSVKSITSNTISGSTGYGIYVYNNSSTTGDITSNIMTSCTGGGIGVSTSSSVGSIKSNTITDTDGSGIMFYSTATVNGDISGNVITNAISSGSAIKLDAVTVNGSVSGNTICTTSNTYSCKNGILLQNSALVTGDIIDNDITANMGAAIYISSGTVNGTVQD